MGEDASARLYGVRVLLLDFLFIIDWLINLVYPHVGVFFFFFFLWNCTVRGVELSLTVLWLHLACRGFYMGLSYFLVSSSRNSAVLQAFWSPLAVGWHRARLVQP